jgi:hypothetical protein
VVVLDDALSPSELNKNSHNETNHSQQQNQNDTTTDDAEINAFYIKNTSINTLPPPIPTTPLPPDTPPSPIEDMYDDDEMLRHEDEMNATIPAIDMSISSGMATALTGKPQQQHHPKHRAKQPFTTQPMPLATSTPPPSLHTSKILPGGGQRHSTATTISSHSAISSSYSNNNNNNTNNSSILNKNIVNNNNNTSVISSSSSITSHNNNNNNNNNNVTTANSSSVFESSHPDRKNSGSKHQNNQTMEDETIRQLITRIETNVNAASIESSSLFKPLSEQPPPPLAEASPNSDLSGVTLRHVTSTSGNGGPIGLNKLLYLKRMSELKRSVTVDENNNGNSSSISNSNSVDTGGAGDEEAIALEQILDTASLNGTLTTLNDSLDQSTCSIFDQVEKSIAHKITHLLMNDKRYSNMYATTTTTTTTTSPVAMPSGITTKPLSPLVYNLNTSSGRHQQLRKLTSGCFTSIDQPGDSNGPVSSSATGSVTTVNSNSNAVLLPKSSSLFSSGAESMGLMLNGFNNVSSPTSSTGTPTKTVSALVRAASPSIQQQQQQQGNEPPLNNETSL